MNGDVREYKYRYGWLWIAFFYAMSCPGLAFGSDWLMTMSGVFFAVPAVFLTHHRLTSSQLRLVLGSETMTVPTAPLWSRKEKEIAYRYIVSLSKISIRGNQMLHIKYRGDNRVDGDCSIQAFMLPSQAVYSEVCELLASRVRKATNGRAKISLKLGFWD
ncbi:MAG: hypothetical protein FWH15_05550 [Betaproteobacteria bacterium]|nr:hypothetical protein [Betaproteobacteria bacterium]